MKRIITLALLACICLAAEAKLTVSSVCSDGMVLQQKTDAAIWGFANPGSQISVTPSRYVFPSHEGVTEICEPGLANPQIAASVFC